MAAILVVLSALASGQVPATQSASAPLTVADVERTIDECPSVSDLQWITHPIQPAEPAPAAAQKRLEFAMRKLQPATSGVLREALVWFERRCEIGTSEFFYYKRAHLDAIRKRHPDVKPDDIDIWVAREASEPLHRVFWIDRFLFDAPEREQSTQLLLCAVTRPRAPYDGYLPRLFPVVVVDGVPRLTPKEWHVQYDGGLPGAADCLEEFDYYEARYKRRAQWWK